MAYFLLIIINRMRNKNNQSILHQISFKLINTCKGQSLAEFAVITAMMATFITTALPALSNVMESGKQQKSIDELDKLLVQAKNFYETTAALEGRGRLPGQDKYIYPVGGYDDLESLLLDLETFTTYTNEDIGKKWMSVFGKDNPKALMPDGAFFQDDEIRPDVDDDGVIKCRNCPVGRETGTDEWLYLFSNEELISPFQDGHYIYVVIPGGNTGEDVTAPRLCVADSENPRDLHKIIEF